MNVRMSYNRMSFESLRLSQHNTFAIIATVARFHKIVCKFRKILEGKIE